MKPTTLSVKINGMHCTSCAMSIDFELEDIDGVLEVATSYTTQIATVKFDPIKVNREHILATISKLGYTVHDTKKKNE